eukprot:jgi/Botrbrau1/18793/Bobra.0386s0107.1
MNMTFFLKYQHEKLRSQIFRKQKEDTRCQAEERVLRARVKQGEIDLRARLEKEGITYVKAQKETQVFSFSSSF